MFQDFERKFDAAQSAERIGRLRALLAERGIDGYVVPRADEHQGEYVPASAERLAYLTGFSGSAGLAVVLAKAAALFVDGRYTVQAAGQVDRRLLAVHEQPPRQYADWICEKLATGSRVAFDPWLTTLAEAERLAGVLEKKGIALKAIRGNLVDRVWGSERPAPPAGPVIVHPHKLAGRSSEDKIGDLQRRLAEAGEDAVVLTLPDSISWLFNIRGSDVAHNPVVLAFAVVPVRGRPTLFVDPDKLDAKARAHIEAVASLEPPGEAALRRAMGRLRTEGLTVRLDPATAASWFAQALGGKRAKLSRAADPCLLPKARKNAAEIKGARRAHERDGAAVVRFLAWLDRAVEAGEQVDEITTVERLEAFRAETGALREVSFDTISGSGPNGAIVHYRVTRTSNRVLRKGELFLLDSGAQYVDGTTDITRTIAIGRPTAEMCERFTLVLKGHIAVSTARFPQGTRGVDLDPMARRALWMHGLDYAHGTGHGVGSYLSVHEGPASISRRGMVALEPGMILSNEPGYYSEGRYGIRIENLVLVSELKALPGGDMPVMGFEVLTLAPIDRRLVDRRLLTGEERAWLDDYHARVRTTLSPMLAPPDRTWLAKATAPLE
ncbi:MAG: aminopeptidase P family protein [Hyphomicrobiaceae bacterium]|nr:aminopeptidase P family protein [Hyphomicrobiaceae bacterium]